MPTVRTWLETTAAAVQTVGVKMVAFDLDGTLVDQRAAARLWAAEFVESCALQDEIEAIAGALTQRRPKGEIFADLIEEYGLPIDPEHLWADYRRRMPELVTCTEADKTAIALLRSAGWKVGIVTNGRVDNQVGKIRSLGLDKLVHGWVISEEIGVRKPAPEIFQALASRLKCPLSGWMVGDSIEHDMAGGAAAGLRTAWVTSEPAASYPAVNVSVRSVAAAVDVIMT